MSSALKTPTRLYLVVSVLLVAANLRGTITSVGPVLDQMAIDLVLPISTLGVLGSLPLVAFAVVSPFVRVLTRRIGTDRTVLVALVLLVLATVLRSLAPDLLGIALGTVLIGAAIAVCNVLVPSIVKHDFPDEVAVMTGIYSALLSGFAALASGLAIPLTAVGGWRLAIGIWALPVVVAILVWLPRSLRRATPAAATEHAEPSAISVWRSPLAWQVTAFVAMQTLVFFLLVNWLPTIEMTAGYSADAAGWHLFLFQIVGILAGLAVTALLRGRDDQRLVGLLTSLLMAAAMLGLLFVPDLMLLWVILAGASAGSTLVVAFTFIAERASTAAQAGDLSGMAQGVGYLIAAAGPVTAGALFGATGSWVPTILIVVVASVVQGIVALGAGRARRLS